jgi:hypothetical protein
MANAGFPLYKKNMWDESGILPMPFAPSPSLRFMTGMMRLTSTNLWLVVTGTMEFYDFPFSWECHDPN